MLDVLLQQFFSPLTQLATGVEKSKPQNYLWELSGRLDVMRI
jgi:hypothetical protein